MTTSRNQRKRPTKPKKSSPSRQLLRMLRSSRLLLTKPQGSVKDSIVMISAANSLEYMSYFSIVDVQESCKEITYAHLSDRITGCPRSARSVIFLTKSCTSSSILGSQLFFSPPMVHCTPRVNIISHSPLSLSSVPAGRREPFSTPCEHFRQGW